MKTGLLSLILVACTAALPGQESKETPRGLPTVYVQSVPADSEEGEDLASVTDEVRDKIADRKKWFRLTEDPLKADVRLEVLRAGKADEVKPLVDRQESTQSAGGQPSGTVSRPGLPDIEEGHFIECRYTIPGKFQGTILVTGRNLDAAAKEVPRRLKTLCDASCR